MSTGGINLPIDFAYTAAEWRTLHSAIHALLSNRRAPFVRHSAVDMVEEFLETVYDASALPEPTQEEDARMRAEDRTYWESDGRLP